MFGINMNLLELVWEFLKFEFGALSSCRSDMSHCRYRLIPPHNEVFVSLMESLDIRRSRVRSLNDGCLCVEFSPGQTLKVSMV